MPFLKKLYTAERASEQSPSDNVLFQRQLFAYEYAAKEIKGRVLEIGCGEGYGTRMLAEKVFDYTAIDKFVPTNMQNFSKVKFLQMEVPYLSSFQDNSFDSIICFQLIEHIEDDKTLLKEIHRVLAPSGKLYLTTPNVETTLTRNPYHIREYTTDQFRKFFDSIFVTKPVNYQGLYGDEKVNAYNQLNKSSIERWRRFDIFDLEHRLPRKLFQLPYDILNRLNRIKLKESNDSLVAQITTANYFLKPMDGKQLDFYCIAEK